MKKIATLCIVIAISIFSHENLLADRTIDFSQPPYSTLAGGTTIVGTDGWALPFSGNTSASTNATIVTAPWDGSKKALQLAKAGTTDYQIRLLNTFTPAFRRWRKWHGRISLSFDAKSGNPYVIPMSRRDDDHAIIIGDNPVPRCNRHTSTTNRFAPRAKAIHCPSPWGGKPH